MSEYIRNPEWEKVTITNDYARQYFKNCGLTYNDVTEGDIIILVSLLNKAYKKANKEHLTSVTMSLSKKIDFVNTPKLTMKKCFLYVNGTYFTRRECISFNEDGFIGFCGWADTGNTRPVLEAFIKWCDLIKDEREAEND